MKTFGRALVVCAAIAGLPALADVSFTTADSIRAAKVDKKAAKKAARHQTPVGRRALATGSISLIDASGLKYFINTNITFSTSSSASGAMSEASYTHAVQATTSMGGNVASTLNDMFDGYNTICLNIGANVALPCETGVAGQIFYNKNGPAALDAGCANRQVVFPVQTIGGLHVQRKVYVPTSDSFARWLNIISNPTASPILVRVGTGNNLGSDANTIVTDSSTGASIMTSTLWVTTFQNYSGTTSSDPRIGHVLQGPGATATPLSSIHFVNGDDNPYWGYDLTVPPGATRVIMNFVTGQPSKAAAKAKAQALTTPILPPVATACMTPLEQGGVVNFSGVGLGILPIPSLSTTGLFVLGAALALSAAAILRKSIL